MDRKKVLLSRESKPNNYQITAPNKQNAGFDGDLKFFHILFCSEPPLP